VLSQSEFVSRLAVLDEIKIKIFVGRDTPGIEAKTTRTLVRDEAERWAEALSSSRYLTIEVS
jgi:hypothetical protein